MVLNPAQLATFKADILANQAANVTAGDIGAIVTYYNSPSASGTIWRSDITTEELNTAIVWADFAALTVAKQNTYLAMLAPGTIDATNANIRSGFVAVFGSGTASTINLTALAQRTPTRFEALFTSNQISAVYNQNVNTDVVVRALHS
jgi:hypothetical protein